MEPFYLVVQEEGATLLVTMGFLYQLTVPELSFHPRSMRETL